MTGIYYPRAQFASRGLTKAELDYLALIGPLTAALAVVSATVGVSLQTEDGDFVLTESGDHLLLEA